MSVSQRIHNTPPTYFLRNLRDELIVMISPPYELTENYIGVHHNNGNIVGLSYIAYKDQEFVFQNVKL
jgi:hypothetical protein